MASILICDICKKQLSNVNIGKVRYWVEDGTKPSCSLGADLCKDCYKKFLEFLKGESR